jgi:hypothetical protein
MMVFTLNNLQQLNTLFFENLKRKILTINAIRLTTYYDEEVVEMVLRLFEMMTWRR